MTLRIAHRGYSGTHPENTMVAFRRGIEVGADGIEFDVHRSKDGQLIVMHDETVNRTTNGNGLIMGMTLAELKALDAGAWKGTQFAGEQVPTLLELIRATPATCQLFLELKAGSIHYPGIEEELVAMLRAEGATGRTQISSFDHVALHKLHQLAPELPLGMLYSENLLDPLAVARSIGADALHPNWPWVTPDLVAKAHAAGLQVNVWTVDQPQFIKLMQACGVDGIISNYPDRI